VDRNSFTCQSCLFKIIIFNTKFLGSALCNIYGPVIRCDNNGIIEFHIFYIFSDQRCCVKVHRFCIKIVENASVMNIDRINIVSFYSSCNGTGAYGFPFLNCLSWRAYPIYGITTFTLDAAEQASINWRRATKLESLTVLCIIVTSEPISSMTRVYSSPSGNFLNSLIRRFDSNDPETLPQATGTPDLR